MDLFIFINMSSYFSLLRVIIEGINYFNAQIVKDLSLQDVSIIL